MVYGTVFRPPSLFPSLSLYPVFPVVAFHYNPSKQPAAMNQLGSGSGHSFRLDTACERAKVCRFVRREMPHCVCVCVRGMCEKNVNKTADGKRVARFSALGRFPVHERVGSLECFPAGVHPAGTHSPCRGKDGDDECQRGASTFDRLVYCC